MIWEDSEILEPVLVVNSFSAKPCLIFHTHKAPIPSRVAARSESVLGIWVSVWVGLSVATVKPPQAVLPAVLDHADRVFSLTQAYF